MSVNPDVITQPQPDAKPSIKAKITSRFPRFRKGEQTPREVLEEAVADPRLETSQPEQPLEDQMEVQQPRERTFPLDPTTEYMDALKEIETEESALGSYFDRLKKQVEGIPEQEKYEHPQRVFTKLDTLRHKKLAALAAAQGVRNLKAFNELVRFFEANATYEKNADKNLKIDASEEEKIEAKAKLEKKGFERVNSYEDGKKIRVYGYKEKYLDIQASDVGELKRILQKTEDPVRVFSFLKDTGWIDFNSRGVTDMQDANYYRTSLFRDPQKIMEILEAPHLTEAVQLSEKIKSLYGRYSFHSKESHNPALDSFIAFANGEVPDLSDDFTGKLNILTKGMRVLVDPNHLGDYADIINDPEKLEFISQLLATRNSNESSFELVGGLSKEGLIPTVSTLLKSGITYIEDRGYKTYILDRTGGSKRVLELPLVKEFLANPDKLRFAEILDKIGFSNSIESVNALYGQREDFMTMYKMIFPSLEWQFPKEEGYRSYDAKNKIPMFTKLYENEVLKTIFLDPKFQKFIAEVESSGVKLSPEDFFRDTVVNRHYVDYGTSHRYEDIHELEIITLYKLQDVIKTKGELSVGRLIESLRPTNVWATPEAKQAVDKFVDYKQFLKYAPLISLLESNGIVIGKEQMETEWLGALEMKPFMGLIVNGTDSWAKELVESPDFLQSAIVLPSTLQEYFLRSFTKDKLYSVAASDIRKVTSFTQLFSDPSFSRSLDGNPQNTLAEMVSVNGDILNVSLELLRSAPEKFGWLSDAEKVPIAKFVFGNPSLFIQNSECIDFTNQVIEIAGVNSIRIFEEYKKHSGENAMVSADRSLFIDFAHIYKDPQSVKDTALRRGYKMFGDYLTIDSYKAVRSVIDGSISEEALAGLGITQKGEEGVVQMESNMRSLVLDLTSKNFDASLLEGKVYSDFFKAYVRYEISSWGVHSSDNFLQVIQTFKKLQETNPELVGSDMSASGLQEVARLERPKTNDSTFTDSFLSRYATLTGNIQEALGMVNQPRSFSTLGRNIKDKIDETVLVLEHDMGKNSNNPKAQAHIQQRIDKLKAVNPADVKSFQANFSVLAQEKAFHDLLMQAVFVYTFQKFPEQRERMAEILTGSDPNADSISAVLDFTEHMATKEAWASYFTDKNARRAFQNILDTKEINDGLSRLLEVGGKTNNASLVEFVPTRGILMEFSGYLADACWASRYQSTTESFPNITAVIMQDVSRDVPRPVGSSLLIETTATDGTPLLIIRGLNPQESYINHVDIPDFYNKYTEFVKRLAESRKRKAAIVIDNHSGGASTNRPLLYNFLNGQKENLNQIGVSPEDTTFNGYNITNSTYLL